MWTGVGHTLDNESALTYFNSVFPNLLCSYILHKSIALISVTHSPAVYCTRVTEHWADSINGALNSLWWVCVCVCVPAPADDGQIFTYV